MKPNRAHRTPLLILGGILAAAPMAAQQIPTDPVLNGFVPNGEYVLQRDGEPVPDAEIFLSEKAGMVLLIDAPALGDPVLLSPRKNQAVESVPEQKVLEQEDGSRDLLSDAPLNGAGTFQVTSGRLEFSVDGERFALVEAPYSLGSFSASELLEKDPGYAYTARAYALSRPMVQRLEAVSTPTTVVVYFGSWCPFCRHHVPKAIRLAEELEGSQIAFEYHGLPKAFTADPRASKYDVRGVPTGIVFQGGKEIGRINGSQWNIPELTLKKILVD
jgi:thiol-disulfide isomerase/thioredoxin